MSDSSAANGPSAPLEDAGKSDSKSADWEREEISWDAVRLAKFGTRAGRKVDKGLSFRAKKPKRRRRPDQNSVPMAQAEKGRINDAGYAILYVLPCQPLPKI
jgi:hypothetical protein